MKVAIGRGRTQQAVEVREVWLEGELLFVRCLDDDVHAAARALGFSPDAVRADALAAHRRLSRSPSPSAGAPASDLSDGS